MRDDTGVLVLGLGNRLLGDDAAGPLAVDRLAAQDPAGRHANYRDGGTVGLALLPEIEDARALIVIDAARHGGAPGSVRVFEGDAMDRQLGGRKHSVHELALADLLGAAALDGRLPARRALVAVEPLDTSLGLAPSVPVQAALADLCACTRTLLQHWAIDAAAGALPAGTEETLDG